jgi:peptidoglycan/LPS O-acetylase OafA/YrhL
MALRTQESANLDMLRSVAVMLVLGSHVLVAFGLPWEGTAIGVAGRLGVMAFFIHTSLVLMMSLARLEERPGSLVGRFYIRRAFRIYPLAILAVLLVVAFGIPEHFQRSYEAPTAMEFWSNLALMQNVIHARSLSGPLWSLPFEVQMYLLLPFFYVIGKRVGHPLSILAAGFAIWYAEHRLDSATGLRPLLNYAPWFCMGIAAAFRRTVPRLPAFLYTLSLACFLGGTLLANKFLGYGALYGEWALGAAFSLSIPMFVEIQSGAARAVFHLIARYSYGIYLSHLPILWFAVERLAGYPVASRTVV